MDMADVKPIPEGYHSVTPYLIIDGASAAIDFYKKAFGAVEKQRAPGPEKTNTPAGLPPPGCGPFGSRPQPAFVTFAACLPFGPSTTSNSTCWPSFKVLKPSPWISVK